MIPTKIITTENENYTCLKFLSQYLTGHKGIICGGCFKNIFNGEKPKDIDIFFRNFEDWLEAKQQYEKDDDYAYAYDNNNVQAFKNKNTGVVVELCKKVFGTPEEIISNFDFTIVKFAYYNDVEVDEETKEETVVNKVCYSELFFEHLFLKRLVIDDKVHFPMSTFERVIRYSKYDYSPCRETKINLAKAIWNIKDEAEIYATKSLYDGFD